MTLLFWKHLFSLTHLVVSCASLLPHPFVGVARGCMPAKLYSSQALEFNLQPAAVWSDHVQHCEIWSPQSGISTALSI